MAARIITTLAAASTVLATAILPPPADKKICPFGPELNTNLAVYYGQGDTQPRLRQFCDDTHLDIIPIGFINKFPDQTGGYPGSNFGDQCGPEVYKNPDGTDSPLLSNCPHLGPDIKYCQSKGKKILLSLGGAVPNNQKLDSPSSAKDFADFLWRAFGPDKETRGSTFPRPFGDASVDGFDLDIESILRNTADEHKNYGALVQRLRNLYAKEKKQYYISGAPQCIVPDAHLAQAIQQADFDFLFVQFYNTPECSARAYFDHTYGSTGAPTDISFDQWVKFVKDAGSSAKVFLGLPASPQEANDPTMYLQPDEAKQILDHFQCKYPEVFGGAMIYEATSSERNLVNGKPYADVIKKDLMHGNCACEDHCRRPKHSATNTPINPSGTGRTYTPSGTGRSVTPTGSVRPSGSGTRPVNPSSGTGRPNTRGTAPVSGTGRPTSRGTAPVSGTGRPTTRGTAPVSGTGRPTTRGTAPVSGTGRPTTRGTAPVSGTGRPTTRGTAPVSGTGRPTSRGTAPVSGTGSPSSRGTQPVSGTVNPSTRGTQPISGTGSPSTRGSAPASSGTGSPSSAPLTVSPSTANPTTRPVLSSSSRTTFHYTNSSIPATSAQPSTQETQSTSQGSPATTSTAVPITTAGPSTQEVVTTEYVTSFETTCPVTETATSAGHTVVYTTNKVSTVYSTVTKTVCTKCVAPPTPPPAASTQEVVTTVIVYTTLTTCPVTQTVTSNGVPVVETTSTVSTVTETTTSTICTKCVPPPTLGATPGQPGAPIPQGPQVTPAAGNTGSQAPPAQGAQAPANNGAPQVLTVAETVVPVPEFKTETNANAAQATAVSPPFPTGGSNGNAGAAGATGTSAPVSPAASPLAFHGAASTTKAQGGFVGFVLFAMAAVLLL